MKNSNLQKGFAIPIIVAIVAVALVLGGTTYYVNQFGIQEDKTAEEKVSTEKGNDTTTKKNEEVVMDKGKTTMKYSGDVLAGISAPLLDFKKMDYDAALKTNKLVALYFYANWCPICKEEVMNSLYPAFNELMNDKTIGFRVNYNDNQTDADEKTLAKQFGVAYQHTKVFIKNGQRILKSPEGWNKDRYLIEISKATGQ